MALRATHQTPQLLENKDMAENWFEIDKIKLAMKKASGMPIPFAFGVGGKPAEGKLAMHPKREPAFLARQLKKDGFKPSRIIVGTAQTEGKVLIVTCEKEVPKAKKSIKFFLRDNQLRQKQVQLMGPNGEFDAEDDEDETSPDEAVAVDVVDEEIAQDSPEDVADPRLADMRATVEEMSTEIGAMTDAAMRGKLAGALKSVLALINRGDADTAAPAVAKIQTILAQVKPDTEADPDPSKSSDQWATFSAEIEPQVAAALKANHPEAGKIRAVWGFAQEKGEAGDMESAKKAIARLIPMLKAQATTAADAPPTNVVAFQRSRLMWLSAKRDMKSDLQKFKSAVAQQSSDDEDQSDILAVVDELMAEFGAFDTRLEDILDEITNTPEGPQRTKLKKQADSAISDYQASLETPFFKDIDNNPFVAVNVAGRGKQSLNTVKATLT
jgi:hypothetical protein